MKGFSLHIIKPTYQVFQTCRKPRLHKKVLSTNATKLITLSHVCYLANVTPFLLTMHMSKQAT